MTTTNNNLKTLIHEIIKETIVNPNNLSKDEIELEYYHENLDGEQIEGTYKIVPVEIFYKVGGSYRPATRWEPSENPEVDIQEILWVNPKTGVKEPVEDDEVVFHKKQSDSPEYKINNDTFIECFDGRIYMDEWEQEMIEKETDNRQSDYEDEMERRAEDRRDREYDDY